MYHFNVPLYEDWNPLERCQSCASVLALDLSGTASCPFCRAEEEAKGRKDPGLA
jgi:hypothetical protein